MIAVLLATFFAPAKPIPPPADPAVKSASAIAAKVEKQENPRSLERLLEDGVPVANNVPLVLKPAFYGGPAAALALKF